MRGSTLVLRDWEAETCRDPGGADMERVLIGRGEVWLLSESRERRQGGGGGRGEGVRKEAGLSVCLSTGTGLSLHREPRLDR